MGDTATGSGTWSSFAITFALCLGIGLTWAAATPMFGVPDEIAHMVRAAGAVRGELDGEPVPDSLDRTYPAPRIVVPESSIPEFGPGEICYAFQSKQSAECLSFSGSTEEVRLVSSAASYPPTFYLLVGWPSRVSSGLAGLYGMRAFGAAVFAALLALATTSLGTGRRWATGYVGLAMAATPMAWFLSGSVNPSSAAVASGIAAWCGGFQLTRSGLSPSASAWRVGAPLCLLLLLRRDSILWAGLLVLGLAALVRSAERMRQLIRSPHVLAWAAAVVACAIVSSRTGLPGGSALVSDVTTGNATAAFGSIPGYFAQMIGVFGWLDTSLPWAVYILWYMCLGGLLLAAVGFGRTRLVLVAAVVLVLTIAAITAIGAERYPYFQGRYALPFSAGVPLLAGLALAVERFSGRLPNRPLVTMSASLVLVHVLAYYQQFRRYAVSGETTWSLFDDPRWQPPTAPIAVLLLANVVLVVALQAWWFRRGSGVPVTEQLETE